MTSELLVHGIDFAAFWLKRWPVDAAPAGCRRP
jgi:hypothetical protein